MKPWEKYQQTSSSKPWEKYQAPGRPAPEVGEAETALQGFGQGVGFGYLPELQAAASYLYDHEDPWAKRLEYFRNRDAAMQEQRPGVYTAGQLGGAVALPVGGAAKGAGMLSKMGRAAAVGAGTGFAYNPHMGEQGSSMSPEIGERVGNAMFGGAFGAGAQGFVSAVSSISKLVPRATQILSDVNAPPQAKADAAKIIQAAKELNVTPTPGMVTTSPIVRGLESSLEQSPSLAGHVVRKGVNKVRDASQKAMNEIVGEGSSLSKFEAGESVKGGILGKLDKEIAPHRKAFDDLREMTEHNEIFNAFSGFKDPRGRIAKNILNINEVKKMPKEPWATEAKRFADYIMRARTTGDVTAIRRTVGKEFETANGVRRKVLGQIYDKLGRLEETSILRGHQTAAPTEAGRKKLTQDMVKTMRGAKKGYRGVAEKIRGFGEIAELSGSKSPTQFFNSFKKMKAEQVLKKLGNTNDFQLLSHMKGQFPEQFETIRRQKLGELAKIAKGKDGLDVGKFMQATKSLSKEAKELLFGAENVKKYDALETLWRAAPERMGPSGTPQGQQFKGLLNVSFQINELFRKMLYDMLQTPKGQASLTGALNKVKKIEKISKPIEKASGFLSNRPGLLPSVIERTRR